MEYAEQEVAVNELEERVERLRALYDQYFMGIEKIEPMTQRKDVDRRLWVLRREQIRNTGLRFRLQQIISRYNTFGNYWGRILREIENGTYKRDLARAAKRFGTEPMTIAAKRRLGKRGLEEAAKQEAPVDRTVPDAAGAPPTERPTPGVFDEVDAEVSAAFRNADAIDVSATQPGGLHPAPGSIAPPKATARPRGPAIPVELDDDDDLFAGLDMRSGRPPSGSMPAAPSSQSRVPLPRPSIPLPTGVSRPPSAPGAARPPGPPPAPGTARPPGPPPAPGTARPPGPPPAPGTARPPSPPLPVPSRPVPAPATAATPSTPAAPAPRPSAPQAPQPRPSSPQPVVRSGLAASSPLAQVPDRPVVRSGLAQSTSNNAKPVAPAPPATPPTAARPSAPSGDLSDARVKELYAKYVDAKRQCNESTAALTSDNLAKSLRDSANKLKQKHAGKNVDFDVVIKDGKAILKPILRG